MARDASITTFEIEELLGTKLRALFQRRKGRDLFDLCVALEAGIDPAAVVEIFRTSIKRDGRHVTRALFEENLAGKIDQPAFTEDVQRLLPPGVTFDVAAGAERIQRELIALLPGDAGASGDRIRGSRRARRYAGAGNRRYPVKLKLDENLPDRIAASLVALGHDEDISYHLNVRAKVEGSRTDADPHAGHARGGRWLTRAPTRNRNGWDPQAGS